jgi:ABC-type antimicrobial peptide transport system permease subunit
MTKQFEANGTLQQIAVSPQTDITWQDNSGGGNNCSTCIKLTDGLISKIQALPHVTGVTRKVQLGGFQYLSYNNQKLRVNQVVAYDTNGIITSNMLAGRDISSTDKDGTLTISSDYADKLGFKGNYQGLVGKQVSIITQGYYSGVGANLQQQLQAMQQQSGPGGGGGNNNVQPPPTTLTGTIVGITDTSNSNYTIRVPLVWARGMDEQQSYQISRAAQDAANAVCQNSRNPNCRAAQPAPTLVVTDQLAVNGYDSLVVKADSTSNVKAAVASIKRLGVGAADAQTTINSQLSIFNILGYVLGGIGAIALVVAAVGVVNTMIMAILERTREIGVMRAVGAKRSTVSWLFTIEASLLGFMGGIFGLLVGYALTLVANPIINKQLATNGIKSRDIITLPPWLIISVIAITTLIGLLAGLYPARRAAKLDPVEALHYE